MVARGSPVQPYLSALDAQSREQFLAAYSEKIAVAYKPRFDGKVLLLRFPRLFIFGARCDDLLVAFAEFARLTDFSQRLNLTRW